MNIIFTKLPTTDGTIKISLDGGQSFTDYSIANIPEDGISLSDDQDFEKIRIKGPANILKNLNIVSGVKVEGASGENGGNGGSVKLYAWNNPNHTFSYQRVYTYSENPQVNDVVISGAEGDTDTVINIGKITSVEDGTFRVDLSLCCTEYNTRCPDDDIKLTVNSDVDLSEYVEKKYFQGELYDGGCGYGFRITSMPDGFDYSCIYSLYLSDGKSLGELCEFDGHGNSYEDYQYDSNGNKIMPSNPTGQLYFMFSNYHTCPPTYGCIPTHYFLN